TQGNLVGTDTLTGSLARDPGENVGQYAITQGTLGNPNYAITYVGNNLTINPRAITIKAQFGSKVYGDADPTLLSQLTSGTLTPGDSINTGTNRQSGENVGSYTVYPNVSNLSNYAITYVNGLLTINPRAITVEANAQSKVYGDADPALTYKVNPGGL